MVLWVVGFDCLVYYGFGLPRLDSYFGFDCLLGGYCLTLIALFVVCLIAADVAVEFGYATVGAGLVWLAWNAVGMLGFVTCLLGLIDCEFGADVSVGMVYLFAACRVCFRFSLVRLLEVCYVCVIYLFNIDCVVDYYFGYL